MPDQSRAVEPSTAYRPPVDPARFAHVDRPTLVVDRARALRNLRRMADKTAASGVRFRPHVKTHNSPLIAELYRDVGVTAITVSSVEWARVFADAGWRDITIAFPVNVRALPELRRLATEVHLGLLVDSVDAAEQVRAIEAPVDIWLDVDAGYRRTGIDWDDEARVAAVAEAVAGIGHHRVAGVLTHSGQSYRTPGESALRALFTETAERLAVARDVAGAALGRTDLEISVGDTPTCSAVERFEGVDEVRAGNFVFFDLQQLSLGACTPDDLGLTVGCPVVGVYPARGEIVVQGGKVHLSADTAPGPDGAASYGQLAVLGDEGARLLPASMAWVRSVSQEHGVIRCAADVLDQVRVGDLLFIVPAHACMPGNLIRELVVL